MKKTFLVLLLLSPSAAWAQIALVGFSGSSGVGGSSVTVPNSGSPVNSRCTTSSCNTAGSNLIVINTAIFGNAPCTISDSAGNTYTALTIRQATSVASEQIFYAINPVLSSTHTWTCTGSSVPAMNVAFFSGVSTFDLQSGATNGAGTTTIQPGSITPTGSNELFVVGCSSNEGSTTTFSIDSGFTKLSDMPSVASNSIHGAQGYIVQGAGAALNPTCTNGVSSASGLSAAMATFTLSGGATAGSFMLMGIGR